MSALPNADGWTVAAAGFPVGEDCRAAFEGLDAAVDPVAGTIAAVWEYEGSPECVVIDTGDGEAVVAFDRVRIE